MLGAISGDALRQIIRINLPVSALMTFCPLIATTIAVYRQGGSAGVKRLLSRAFDQKRITDKRWYIAILCVMPIIMFLSYAFMQVTGMPLPDPQIPGLVIPLFLCYFL